MDVKMFADMFRMISQNSTIKATDGDYTEKGLLHCGKCHTPKQTEIVVGNECLKVYCLCQCAENEEKAKKEQIEKIQFQNDIELNRDRCFPAIKYKSKTFTTDTHIGDNITMQRLEQYSRNFSRHLKENNSLILTGSIGIGKTFSACCVANSIVDQGYTAKFTTISRIMNELFGLKENRQMYIDSLCKRVDLLIIDGLTFERLTDYTVEVIENLFDTRIATNKPFIVTTSLNVKDHTRFKTTGEKNIINRLVYNAIVVEMHGDDLRVLKKVEQMKNFEF